jgi:hypothetical protein
MTNEQIEHEVRDEQFRLNDTISIIYKYKQTELVDLLTELLSTSPSITKIVYGMVIKNMLKDVEWTDFEEDQD